MSAATTPRFATTAARPSATTRRLSPARIGAIFAAGLAGTLLLAALRMDVTRMSYENQALFDREKKLIAERSELTVELRQLRSPARLAAKAEALGFARPERLVDMVREDTLPPVSVGAIGAAGGTTAATIGHRATDRP